MTYLQYFKNTPVLTDLSVDDFAIVEPGYVILSSLVRSLGGSFEVLSTIWVIIIYFNFTRVFKFFSKNIDASIFLYFALFYLSLNYNLVRHGIMVSFVWSSFVYLINDNKRRFILILGIGSLFHLLSLFFIFFIFFLKKRFGFYVYAVVLLLSLYISFNISIILTLFEFLGNKLGDTGSRLVFYLAGGHDGELTSYGYSLGLIFNIMLFSLAYFFISDNIGKYLVNILFVGIISLLILNSLNVFAERIASVCFVANIFLIPCILSHISNRNNLLLLFVLLTIFYALGMFYGEVSKIDDTGFGRYLPYKMISLR